MTRSGTYKFKVMPFGLLNALETFQEIKDLLLKNVSFARVYLDDDVIFTKHPHQTTVYI